MGGARRSVITGLTVGLAIAWCAPRDARPQNGGVIDEAERAIDEASRGPTEVPPTSASCHDFGADRGVVCCEWWTAHFYVNGADKGAVLEQTYEETVEQIAQDEQFARDVLCPYWKDDDSCNGEYEEPRCAWQKQPEKHKPKDGGRDPDLRDPVPPPDARPPPPDREVGPKLRARMSPYEQILQGWPWPDCNPLGKLRDAVDQYLRELEDCLNALEQQVEQLLGDCPEGWSNLYCEPYGGTQLLAELSAPTGDPVNSLFAGKLAPKAAAKDPLKLWSVRGEFGGATKAAGFSKQHDARAANCARLAERGASLDLPDPTILELERDSRAKALPETKGPGRLLFGTHGTLDDGELLPAGDIPVVFALVDKACNAQFKPAVIYVEQDPKGRRIKVTGQIDDSYESIELLEEFPDRDEDKIYDKDDRCPETFGYVKWDGCPDPDPDRDKVLVDEDVCPEEKGRAETYGCPDHDKDDIADHHDACPDERGSRDYGGCPPDRDGDGVVDKKDKCPDEPGEITFKGCGDPDPDGDRVKGKKDRCPDVAGLSALKGCPDGDDDGVADDDDQCPWERGQKDLDGCPPADSDGDGIFDQKDRCPDTWGIKKHKGCADPDPDRDGVKGDDDRCPDDKGKKKMSGCPDSDGDGTADIDDACPNEAGDSSRKGCPWRDSDGDGIEDRDDSCQDEYGDAARGGCPVRDADGDGVEDGNDQCDSEYGGGNANGCPTKDADGDGIPDDQDSCPREAGQSKWSGCTCGIRAVYVPVYVDFGPDVPPQLLNELHNVVCCCEQDNDAVYACGIDTDSVATATQCCTAQGGQAFDVNTEAATEQTYATIYDNLSCPKP